jgi:hypothetical protein
MKVLVLGTTGGTGRRDLPSLLRIARRALPAAAPKTIRAFIGYRVKAGKTRYDNDPKPVRSWS